MTVIKALVPHAVLEAAKTAVRDGDDDSAGIVFEVLDELTESRTNALSGQVPEVVSFCIQVARRTEVEHGGSTSSSGRVIIHGASQTKVID